MARTRNQSAITEAIDKIFVDEKIFTEEELKTTGEVVRQEAPADHDRQLPTSSQRNSTTSASPVLTNVEFRPAKGDALPWPATPENTEGNPIWIGGIYRAQKVEAIGHIEALLALIAGFNANHDPIQGWCRFCDGNYLHTSEACACVCHAARAFVERMREKGL